MPQPYGSQLDSLLLSQEGQRALDPRSRTPISPLWAAIGAIMLLAVVTGLILLFR